jgi:hypothetical protein
MAGHIKITSVFLPYKLYFSLLGDAMDRQAYRDEIMVRLTGGLIDLELSDEALDGCINSAFR